MRKKLLLLFVFSLFFASVVNAQESKKEVVDSQQLTKLSENVYAYIDIKNPSPAGNSFGANAGVVIGKDAVLVIDTLISAKHGKKLIAQIKEVTDKPIKYVVNTHSHLDHAWGNCEFAKLDAVIIGKKAEKITEEAVNQMIAGAAMFGLTPEDMEGTTAKLPDMDIDQKPEVDLGGVTAAFKYYGPSHNMDSITVHVKEDNVLFVGDIVFNKYHPYLGDADIPAWVEVLSALGEIDAAVIVPGHGPAATKEDLRDLALYLTAFDKHAKILSEGKTQRDVAEVAEALMPLLPAQGRSGLPGIVNMNLNAKYLAPAPKEEAQTEEKTVNAEGTVY